MAFFRRHTDIRKYLAWPLIGALYSVQPIDLHAKNIVSSPPPPPYADVADLLIAAPLVIQAKIRSVTAVKDAPTSAGTVRQLIEADVITLIRGPGTIARRIQYLIDSPLDSRGKPPKLKKALVTLFALPSSTRADQVRLAAPDAQLAWTPALDDRVRSILAEILGPGAPPAITGIGNAFSVAGTISGESETQIFLTTADNRPVSLSILRRPGQSPTWSVSLGEIVDETARPPERDTLLWYRLACSLPKTIPADAIDSSATTSAEATQSDYQIVISGLGPCTRARVFH
jgi:hypothetical protein